MRRTLKLGAALVLVAFVTPVASAGVVLSANLFLPLPAHLPERVPPAPSQISRIYDAAGNEVYAQEVDLAGGDNVYAWQGKSSDGQVMPDGFYTIQVIARDAEGKMVTAKTDIQGVVTGVELEDGQPVLKIGDTIRVKLANVKSVVNQTASTED